MKSRTGVYPSRVRRRVASKFAVRVGKRERGVTASASERRLASHLLRRQSMTLPSTVEERTTIYTHNTYTRKIYTETRSRTTPPEQRSARPAFPGKNRNRTRRFRKRVYSNASGILFQGKKWSEDRPDGRKDEGTTHRYAENTDGAVVKNLQCADSVLFR